MLNKKTYFWLSLAIMAAVTINLRAPINSMGPSIEAIKAYYGISSSVAGLLNSIPLIAFGSISFIVAYFSNTKILFIALCAIALGEVVRSFCGVGGLFVGMALMGAGIAVGNVVIPSFVKKKFPKNAPTMMSVYSLFLNLSSILGIALALPLIDALGIRLAMFVWIGFALIAIALFYPEIKNHRFSRPKPKQLATKSLLANKNAWRITLFMGLQGFVAYCTFTWLPLIIASKGYSLEYGTRLLLYMQLASFPVAMLGPLAISKMRERCKSWYMAAICGMYVVGYMMILLLDSRAALLFSMVCIGIPMGGVFGLALLFIAQKSANTAIAIKLSAMAQGFGYLIAASGPFLVGLLHDMSEGYTAGIFLVLIVAILLNICGIFTQKCKMIE